MYFIEPVIPEITKIELILNGYQIKKSKIILKIVYLVKMTIMPLIFKSSIFMS